MSNEPHLSEWTIEIFQHVRLMNRWFFQSLIKFSVFPDIGKETTSDIIRAQMFYICFIKSIKEISVDHYFMEITMQLNFLCFKVWFLFFWNFSDNLKENLLSKMQVPIQPQKTNHVEVPQIKRLNSSETSCKTLSNYKFNSRFIPTLFQ